MACSLWPVAEQNMVSAHYMFIRACRVRLDVKCWWRVVVDLWDT